VTTSSADSADLTIRPLRPADLGRVKAITVEGFAPVSVEAAIERRWPGLLPSTWGERKWLMMQPEVVGHPEHCYVAEIDGVVVGYVTTIVSIEHKVGRIPDLAVDARYQGRGVGRRLLDHALARFREQGLHVARIETLAHNDVGQHLYPSLGFQEMARQIHYAMPLVPGDAPPAAGTQPAKESH
jgi:ribosomal protein S18 acetylase RimI-like enzyme